MLYEAGTLKFTGLHGVAYTAEISVCSKCGSLVDANYAEKHAQSHQSSSLIVEVRWNSDDYAVFYVNGRRVGYYDHDQHGRDGLDGMLRLAEETARVLGGEFRSDN